MQQNVDVGPPTANTKGDANNDGDLLEYQPISPKLPPASSDRRKWWLDNGKFRLTLKQVILCFWLIE